MTENTLVAHRWVRLMCDYCADGVWDRDGYACEAADLPVEPALVARIVAWQGLFETSPTDAGFGDWEHGPRFVEEGWAIARAVKAALPDWTVIYFDEAAFDADYAATVEAGADPRLAGSGAEVEIVLPDAGSE